MIIIFRFWLESARFLLPSNFAKLCIHSIKLYYFGLKNLISIFWWLILTELGLFLLFGKKIFDFAAQQDKVPPMSLLLANIAVGIIGLILTASLILFIRKGASTKHPIKYLKEYLIRYIQLSLFFTLFFLVLLSLLSSFGISKIPSFHWSLLLTVRCIELLTLFFWLDSKFYFKDIFTSIEKAFNFFIYNLPFFIVLIVLMWAINTGVFFLFFGTLAPEKTALLSNKTQQLASMITKETPLKNLIGFKYAFFFLEFLWASIIFAVYRKKKRKKYSESLFNQ